jgi:hypothetical protein
MQEKREPKQNNPSNAADVWLEIEYEVSVPKVNDIKTNDPRTKFGTVVATVARKFVPNCSAAIVIKIAQYPILNPIIKTNA